MAQVIHDPENSRFELREDGERLGLVEYAERGGRLLFLHTETDPARQGQGLGSELIRGALDQARASGKPIVPLCPFVARYIAHHPEYEDLLDGDLIARLDEPPTPLP